MFKNNIMTPYIISASRRKDIPAWKVSWFLEQIKNSKVEMGSSFAEYEISFEKVQLIVFWTKNPRKVCGDSFKECEHSCTYCYSK